MKRWLLVCLMGSLLSAAAGGQQRNATPLAQLPADRSVHSEPVAVQLGSSAVDLFGPWRFHEGDDPRWSGIAFDDSGWETVDLHAPEDPPKPEPGTSGFAPGWTAHGHTGYAGYAWYRLRVVVHGADRRLALKMPDSFDDAYQVFINGQRIGEFGHFGRRQEWAYPSQPRGFPLPPDVRDGPVEIALRMWMDSASRFTGPDAGGLHGPPMIGSASSIADYVTLDWNSLDHQIGSGFLEMLVLLLTLGVALTHFMLDRSERAYFLLGLVAAVTLLGNLILQMGNYTTVLSTAAVLLTRDVLLTPLRIGLWVVFWAAWFCLRLPGWFSRAAWGLMALTAVATLLLRPPLHGQLVPLGLSPSLGYVLAAGKLGLAVLLFYVAYRGISTRRAEGSFALPAILLGAAANYQHELHLAHVRVHFLLLGYDVSLGQLSTMLSLSLVTLMGSRRFLAAQRRKVQYRLEVEQAGELQQVILPRQMPEIAGLRIESEYRPSREVGGDFFQILPQAEDGSVLIVVGDVTGKGLRAGMLVALIVGVLDSAAREMDEPATLLEALNAVLCHRGYATATCLAVKVTRDGVVRVASAGHPAPYLNMQEVAMEGALPLGLVPEIGYPEHEQRLRPGDTLTLITDGVVEAQNAKGELFGFDRLCAMVGQRASAGAIAHAAQQFGQEDDILVLRVERLGEMVPLPLGT